MRQMFSNEFAPHLDSHKYQYNSLCASPRWLQCCGLECAEQRTVNRGKSKKTEFVSQWRKGNKNYETSETSITNCWGQRKEKKMDKGFQYIKTFK
jgi:hypothetical protein